MGYTFLSCVPQERAHPLEKLNLGITNGWFWGFFFHLLGYYFLFSFPSLKPCLLNLEDEAHITT